MSKLKASKSADCKKTSSEKSCRFESEELAREKFRGSNRVAVIYKKGQNETFVCVGPYAIRKYPGECIEAIQKMTEGDLIDLLIETMGAMCALYDHTKEKTEDSAINN
ncbi:hypothetical protein [Dipodfec virus UOA04_Rod_663]|nr:hypothetical protein [Dipodfec virus UOA04_Rod_663]